MNQASGTAATHDSYIVRHWRGALSLPQSYWVNGVVIGMFSSGFFTVLRESIPRDAGIALALLFAIAALIRLAIIVWQLVGIWRSAGRYAGPRHWSLLARICVAVGAIFAVIVVLRDFSEFLDILNP